MQAVYDKAQELADLIADSPAYKRLRQAEHLVEGNAEVNGLVAEYNRKAQQLAEKERNTQPVEPEEKREFEEIRDRIQANPLLQRLLQAQTDYAMMMNKVNSILQAKLGRRPANAEG